MRWAVATLAFFMLAACGDAAAGGVTLTPRESSAAVNVENTGDSTVVIQVRVQAWLQRDGKDVREDTREVIVNPPIFKLARGEQQLVRFAPRAAPPRDTERAYRVVFQEVPPRDSLVGE